MDPNATVREISATNAALEAGEITKAQHRAQVRELRQVLREWKARGGFPPAIGWSAALAL